MALALSSEARLIRDQAQAFFAERSPVRALRQLRDSSDASGFSRPLWQEMTELGWPGFLVSEVHGGSEFGLLGLCLVLEAAGRTLAPTPLLSTALIGASALLLGGSAAQRQEHLSALAAGERLFALAMEEGAHHAPSHVQTRAERTDRGWRLNGEKRFVPDGGLADMLIVTARTVGEAGNADNISLFLVPAATPGVTVSRRVMVDSRNAAAIRLDAVELGEDALLGEADAGMAVLEPLLDRAYVGLAAEMLGLAGEAFDRTLQYLKDRRQFGVPIGSFQALKHRAGLMFCELELLRSAVLGALEALEAGAPEAALLSSAAKAKACDAVWLIGNEAIQMHGGIGMTDEHEIGFFLKRARVAQQTFGDGPFHRDRYASLMGY
ncbi:acyl-CoA dehydrogenase family protein [Belnapia moabensis]|uniref:acyl-CoA dehydrogenase family protein n=1 Tax=Belnapia moabensis TaxID=365533 RepID=UPI0005BB2782|nr:acyl-CoA dehydrogenase family protein [Belnapia moabensis]